jgi:parallel beta-helix repeat protein
MLLGIALWASMERVFPRPSPTLTVNPSDPQGIVRALSTARPGDTVEIPSGSFLGPIELKEGVNLIGRTPGQTVLRSADGGVAIVARGIRNARVAGLRIVGGILVSGSGVELDDLDISGARDAGVRIEGASQAVLLANRIHGNPGFGVVIQDASTPRLAGNTITDNGWAGVEVRAPARPVLENNVIRDNGPPI